MDRETKREIIMDYSKDTTHRGLINDDRYFKENTRSDSCIDNMDMMVKLNNDIIEDVLFDGEACAICTSATSIWSDILIGKTIAEAKKIVDNYNKMINEEEYDKKTLGNLQVFDEIALQPARKNCALLPCKTVIKILNDIEGK
ncbi:sUF system FeS assembly protein NifU family [Clostridium sp. CAG:609]|nr:sUF system FeS assembly protein NifU family [Clostridium sp. CAG:609]